MGALNVVAVEIDTCKCEAIVSHLIRWYAQNGLSMDPSSSILEKLSIMNDAREIFRGEKLRVEIFAS